MEIQPQKPEQPVDKAYGLLKQYIATQATIPMSAITPDAPPVAPIIPVANSGSEKTYEPRKKLRSVRLVVIALSILLVGLLLFTWHTFSQQATPETIAPQTFTTLAPKSTTGQTITTPIAENSGSDIQVYIVGAVKHPGVYTLPDTARVYQLIQAAGGPLANANLIAINLAAKLSDGQEVYVAVIGESPPTTIGTLSTATTSTAATGQLVNINTASVSDLRQNLHIASTTAQNIVTYRQEHGNFTSIDQLLQVISKTIYNKIKDQVTLS